MSGVVWKDAAELVVGDRVEIGTVVCRVDEVGPPGMSATALRVTRERDGGQELVDSFLGRYRYVGPPGSDPAQRLEQREASA